MSRVPPRLRIETSLPLAKPPRGTALLERRARRADLRTHERREMHAAKVRDMRFGKFACRFPRCPYCSVHKDLPIDPCHARWTHRGAGGNPDGTRTERRWVISLCRVAHGLYDAAEIDILPHDPCDGFDGTCDFYVTGPAGAMQHWARERIIGVPEART